MWSFKAGTRPNTITVYDRGGMLYARAWDGTLRGGKGNYKRLTLGHNDRQRAKRYATEEAAKLQNGKADILRHRISLALVFAEYLQHRTPKKVVSEQKADKRRAEMWMRILGSVDPHCIMQRKWVEFIDARSSGAIDARGNRVAEKDSKPVRARTVEEDCDYLRQVLNWAAKWTLENGQYLMSHNPVRGFEMPHEANPNRPLASYDRYEALRAVSDNHMMEDRQNRKGKRSKRRSYLSELLDVAQGTGRRISAICQLRFQDLRLERTSKAPHGAIVWPAETDKMGRETTAPLTPGVRAALDRVIAVRPGIGSVPLFPSARDAKMPISRYLADAWLREGEKLADLEPLKGSLWHAYRRAWVTCRKHLPDADVAAAGGWKTVATLKLYQQPDDATMLRVVLGGGQLREAKA
jgi:integrase